MFNVLYNFRDFFGPSGKSTGTSPILEKKLLEKMVKIRVVKSSDWEIVLLDFLLPNTLKLITKCCQVVNIKDTCVLRFKS